MNLKNHIALGINVVVIASMGVMFLTHVKEQDKKLEDFRVQLQQDIQEKDKKLEDFRVELQQDIQVAVNQATDAYRKAQEAEAQIGFLKQRDCLAANIYHEAGIESDAGKKAVAWVTINRVANEKYPDTICDVVYQAKTDDQGHPIKNECQFSWYCDGKGDEIKDMSTWNRSVEIANSVMDVWGKETDPTNGSIMYHADYVEPFWVSAYVQTVKIDTHIFYK